MIKGEEQMSGKKIGIDQVDQNLHVLKSVIRGWPSKVLEDVDLPGLVKAAERAYEEAVIAARKVDDLAVKNATCRTIAKAREAVQPLINQAADAVQGCWDCLNGEGNPTLIRWCTRTTIWHERELDTLADQRYFHLWSQYDKGPQGNGRSLGELYRAARTGVDEAMKHAGGARDRYRVVQANYTPVKEAWTRFKTLSEEGGPPASVAFDGKVAEDLDAAGLTLVQVFNMNQEQLQEFPGIGPVTAEQICKQLHDAATIVAVAVDKNGDCGTSFGVALQAAVTPA